LNSPRRGNSAGNMSGKRQATVGASNYRCASMGLRHELKYGEK
jgi:hypothetical protein